MIKIYKVDTFEKFDYLLKTLHGRGAKWCDECILDNKKVIAKVWNKFNLLEGAYKGVAIYNENGTITFSTPPFIHYMIKLYEKERKEYTIIEDVKLPKPKEKPKVTEIYFHDTTGGKLGGDRIFKVTEEIQVHPYKSDTVEQPSHYIGEHGLEVREIEENFLVRYQDGHLAHLAGALLEYLLRAPSKGKLTEDIQKVQYLANEMAEYVEKVSQE
ncbi:DUF3310 domain-containing protein [Abiotrophia defectiva]|uniref:DUF3310 domain-containing protein n=1 Tax=Abiotrophia defectiva TaxID=46125 RepID=UPI0026EBFC06|nr:DUF3310 domain-containing protein [Abiotrophia defectiva]